MVVDDGDGHISDRMATPWHLHLSQDKANQDVANTLFWRACLAAGYVLQWHALYQTLPHVKADAWTKKHIWEAQIQVRFFFFPLGGLGG